MKKIKGFTLLEMLLVIVIIWIVSVSLASYKKNTRNSYEDTWREAVNIIYKEMNQFVKDFQRNKIWEDTSWHEHEIAYLLLNFNNNIYLKTWGNFTIWNLYLFTWIDNNGTEYQTWHLEWATLITNQKYSAFQVIKWSDNYTFFTRNKNGLEIPWILISNNWKIYTWKIHDIIENNYFNIDTPNLVNNQIYEFMICWWYWNDIKQIWIISINAVTKLANLERCKTEKFAWIDCDNFSPCE